MHKLFGFFTLMLLLTSCSSYSLVNSEVYNDANLSDYHTFRIVTPSDGHLPPGMEMVTYYNIAAAIREQLVERGYTEDPNSSILVNIGLTVKKGVVTEPLYQTITPAVPPIAPVAPAPMPAPGHGPGGPGAPQGPAMSPPPPVYNGMLPYYMYPRAYYLPANTQVVTGVYREGVLTMDIVDMNTKEALYSASVATILNQGDGQLRNLSGIAKAVKVLFSRFPVAILPQYRQN